MTTISHKNFNTRQYELMEVIRRGNPDGTFLDMDQLLKAVPFEITKAAMQFALKFLIRDGVIRKAGREIRRGRRIVTYGCTPMAYFYLDSDPEIVLLELLKSEKD